MQTSRKRKHLTPTAKPPNTTTTTIQPLQPYPLHPRPTPHECIAIRDALLSLHGFPQQFSKHRLLRLSNSSTLSSDDAKCEPSHQETVLDGLLKTVLSQNTTEANSLKAFSNLKSAFPSWDDVLGADTKCIENAIRCGGLAPTKAKCIKNILSCLLERKGKLCLEYLRELSVNEIKAELSCFKGIGPKTIACVLMFNLQQDDFPVDTHAFEIAKTIGWVPDVADRNKTYLHLNHRIPNELKFDLNCLLYTHGKLCRKCSKKGGNQQRKESHDESCPLLNYRKHEVKLLRLFGCDLNPCEGSEEGSRNGDQPVEVPCQMENNAEPNSSEHETRQKMYECEFCFKKFKNSQALGGHQNAHKKERLKKRRLQLQEKTQNYPIHHTSLPYSCYFSPFVPHFKLCQESMISFNSLHNHNRNDISNECYAITGPRFSTCEEYKMPSVIKPSPSYVPNDGQNLYIQLGLAAEIGRDDWCDTIRRT